MVPTYKMEGKRINNVFETSTVCSTTWVYTAQQNIILFLTLIQNVEATSIF